MISRFTNELHVIIKIIIIFCTSSGYAIYHCKCNRNQRLPSRLNKVFHYLPCYIMLRIWFRM